MINIALQSVSVLIVILVLGIFRFGKHIVLRTNLLYYRILLATLLALVLDILSLLFIHLDYGAVQAADALKGIVSDTHPDTEYSLWTLLTCRGYLAMTVVLAYCCMDYVLFETYRDRYKRYRVHRYVWMGVALIGVLAAALSPLTIVDKDVVDGVLHLNAQTTGIGVISANVVGVGMALVAMIISLVHKTGSATRRHSVVAWIAIWMASAVVQEIYNALLPIFLGPMKFTLLIISHGLTIGVVVMFFALEDPNLNYVGQTKIMIRPVLYSYLEDLFNRKQDFGLIGIVVGSYLGEDQLSLERRREINTYLSEAYGHFHLFSVDGEFWCMILPKRQKRKMKATVASLQSRFGLNAHFLVLEDPSIVHEHQALISGIRPVQRYLRNAPIVYLNQEIVAEVRKTIHMESVVSEAIFANRVIAYYQPFFNARTGRFNACESLARIKTKDGQILYPGQFIPICEENGWISELGSQVFEQVCRFIETHDMKALGLDSIEVNLSIIQVGDPEISKRFIQIMEAHHVDPKYINLEIAESRELSTSTIRANLQGLIDYGVRFSLDDFGTGNSNLNYALQLPFISIIKYDKTLTDKCFVNPKAALVVEKSIESFRSLHYRIVMEGLEDSVRVQKAVAMKADFIQGYYFSKPVDEKDYVAFLKRYNRKRPGVKSS